jgi:hypothetical protein
MEEKPIVELPEAEKARIEIANLEAEIAELKAAKGVLQGGIGELFGAAFVKGMFVGVLVGLLLALLLFWGLNLDG